MRSLRTRVFLTVALIVLAATAAAGLLTRRATLVEEQRMRVVPNRANPADAVSRDADRAFAAGGWTGLEQLLRGRDESSRFLVIDAAGRAVAASDEELASADVRVARPDGTLALLTHRAGTIGRFELTGVPTFPVHASSGSEAGRVFLVPAAEGRLAVHVGSPVLPLWVLLTLGTAAVALVITFAVSGRVLGPVSALTDAARRMREGDLDVRVEPSGDDEIARLGRAFNEMAERLAHTERTKRQLVSDVAHELRSPVTNLRGVLESIQDGLAVPDRARIDALHTETLLLQRLIADLQDLALAESNGLALGAERVDLEAVARRAIGSDSRPAVHVNLDPDARFVHADAGRIEQMLRNLLSNARRHTPADGRIDIRSVRHGGFVRVSVEDTGCGIPAEHLPQIFDRFYRADPSRDRATGGAGLGLAIVRRLAEAHGGSATAASAGPGLGATFSIDLPRADDPSASVDHSS